MSSGDARDRSPARATGPAPSPQHASATEITLRGMRFHAIVGVLPHEREIPQPLEVDVTVWPDRPGALVDYRSLYDAVQTCVATPIGFLEDAGDAIAERILANPNIRRVRVALRKPHVPLPGPVSHAEVVIAREGENASGSRD